MLMVICRSILSSFHFLLPRSFSQPSNSVTYLVLLFFHLLGSFTVLPCVLLLFPCPRHMLWIHLSLLNWIFTSTILWDGCRHKLIIPPLPTSCTDQCTFTKGEPLKVPFCLQKVSLFPGVEALRLLPGAVLVSGWIRPKFYNFGSVL